MLVVGIPKEIKPLERRVALTPSAVRHLCQEGVRVVVQKDAGRESGFRDPDYSASGAQIATDAESLYAKARLIQKVKEPLAPEFLLLRREHVLFSFLHLASPEQCELVRALRKAGLTALAYETLEVEGKLPVLAPMSEIAGSLAALYAAFFKRQNFLTDSKINYPSDFFRDLEAIAKAYPSSPDWEIGRVLIFGGGVAGQKAADYALRLKGRVSVVEKNSQRREALKNQYGSKLEILNLEEDLHPRLEAAEVLIGCVHRAGQRAEPVVSASLLERASAKRKKIIIDISIDQGGNFPESHSTPYVDPLYLDSFGNVRFGVSNIPSLCGRPASEALARATLPYTLALAKDGEGALRKLPELLRAVNVQGGEIKIEAIRQAHRL